MALQPLGEQFCGRDWWKEDRLAALLWVRTAEFVEPEVEKTLVVRCLKNEKAS